MTIALLNVEGSPDQPVASWPYEGLVNVLERGLVSDRRPVFAEIRRQPWGPVARKVEKCLGYCDEAALVSLVSLAIARAREAQEADERDAVAEQD